MTKGQYPSINKSDIESFKIPLPPLDVQKQIVAECEQIDAEYLDSQNEIEKCKNEIENLFIASQKSASDVYKLSDKDIFEVSIGIRILKTEVSDDYDVPVYSANVFEEFGKINKLLLTEFDRSSVIWEIDGDYRIEGISIKVPSLAAQQKIVSQVEVLEHKISAAKNVLAACPVRKAYVLHKLLD